MGAGKCGCVYLLSFTSAKEVAEIRDSENKISMLTNKIKETKVGSIREIQALKDVLAARTEELSEAHIRVVCQISELSKQHAPLRILKKEYGCLLSLSANDLPKKLDLLRNMELSFSGHSEST